VRPFIILVTLIFLLTACQRYTIGAENAAPRVVSGDESVEYGSVWDTAQADELAPHATPNETVVEDPAEEEHSTSLPELDAAKAIVRESFAVVRGGMAARREAAERLTATKESLKALYDSGAISHWEELEEAFYVATNKVREGTNDAPNALNRLLKHLDEAAHH
jgi:hypothetical protein